MSARQDPTRRDDLMFMLLHGGAASDSIARRVVDLAIAEAVDSKEAGIEALQLADLDSRVSATCSNPDHPTWLRKPDDARPCPWCRIAELETLLSDLSEPDVDGAGRTYAEYQPIEDSTEATGQRSVPQQRGEAR